MTDAELEVLERNAELTTAGVVRRLVAEVRRLREGVILPGVEESAELAKLILAKHGGNATSHPRRTMVLPEPELTMTCPVTEAEKAELIADLQRTPIGEIVQFWDQRNGVVGIGCKLKPGSDAAEPQHVVGG